MLAEFDLEMGNASPLNRYASPRNSCRITFNCVGLVELWHHTFGGADERQVLRIRK